MPKFCAVRLLALSCVLVTLNSAGLAQGARVNPSGASEDADRDNPAARDQWFMQGRVAPKGKTAAQLRWQAYQLKIQMRAARIVAARKAAAAGTAARPALAAAGAAWAPLGPAPLQSDPGSGHDYGFVSGRATSVVIDPADATGNTVYLGGAYGGVWRSKNAGGLSSNPSSVTWTPMSDTQSTLAVGAIALQPCSVTLGNCDGLNHLSKTILVGTGEANSSTDSYYGLGILRSIDGGNNWSLIGSANGGTHSFKGLGFSKIAFNTKSTKENNVVAATAITNGSLDGARVSQQIAGPFVSMDSGATWAAAPVNDGSFGGTVAPISATSVIFNAQAGASGTFYMAMRYHGFYSSTDGTSWTRLATQPAPSAAGINSSATCPTSGNSNCPFYRGEMAVVPGRNEMYAWYIDGSDGDQGIWQSTDGGSSWTELDDSNIANCGDQSGCGTVQGFYDLELAAVPNGSSTDLYAGARNLYKCTIGAPVTSSTCRGTGTSSFQNLTHVYNCLLHPTVHPDQHGISSMIVGGADVLYFASDGGIYRALDGFTGLVTNSCTANQFDDLNGSLGSMTQFVSFSQNPTNSAILLGGTQDNGSPATSQTNTNWQSVNGGDGGYNEIDPTNPSNWYTANTDISIQRCTSGTACREQAFALVVDSVRLGGDSGAFYTPYMLDPQNSNELLVGTCRIWRGSSTGTGFVAISPNFDQGSSTICADPHTSVVNFVHSIAAGGPVGTNGFSKVVYAGLSGFGPSTSTTPGGRVFVTNDSGANPVSWSEITPPVNQSAFYTIGDIAIDPSDATGATAFVALQGFGATHVLKTTNASLGISATWTDFSGSLPNAPANSLLIDSATNTVYVGTDVGVFSSLTISPAWTEVGPLSTPGAVGYLPDAPVTRLRLFNSGGSKLLRASTYGRGIWEFSLVMGPPDFLVSVSNATQTSTVLGSATFNGTVTAVNGYAGGTVTLTCGSGAPATCTPPAPIALAPGGSANFTVTASSTTLGAFHFNIHGTDGTRAHDAPVTLTVDADFHVPTTAVACTPVTAGGVSSCSIPIGPDGQATFANDVTYNCATAGFPNLSFCSFSPASLPAGSPGTTVLLSVHTTAAMASLRPSGPFRPGAPLLAFWLSLPALGIVSLGAHRRARKELAWLSGSLLVIALAGFLTACGGSSSGGGGGQPGTSKGTYTFNVNATANGITHSAPMTLTVN